MKVSNRKKIQLSPFLIFFILLTIVTEIYFAFTEFFPQLHSYLSFYLYSSIFTTAVLLFVLLFKNKLLKKKYISPKEQIVAIINQAGFSEDFFSLFVWGHSDDFFGGQRSFYVLGLTSKRVAIMMYDNILSHPTTREYDFMQIAGVLVIDKIIGGGCSLHFMMSDNKKYKISFPSRFGDYRQKDNIVRLREILTHRVRSVKNRRGL